MQPGEGMPVAEAEAIHRARHDVLVDLDIHRMGFLSRQAWGWVSDRIGGLLTALVSSALQAAAMTGFYNVTGWPDSIRRLVS